MNLLYIVIKRNSCVRGNLVSFLLSSKKGIALAIQRTPKGSVLDVSKSARAEMAKLKYNFIILLITSVKLAMPTVGQELMPNANNLRIF